jgi:hypothetical protein
MELSKTIIIPANGSQKPQQLGNNSERYFFPGFPFTPSFTESFSCRKTGGLVN